MLYFIINLLIIFANDTVLLNYKASKTQILSQELLKYVPSISLSDTTINWERPNAIKTTANTKIYPYVFNSYNGTCSFFLKALSDTKRKNPNKFFSSIVTMLSFKSVKEENSTTLIELEGIGVESAFISCPTASNFSDLEHYLTGLIRLDKKEDKI